MVILGVLMFICVIALICTYKSMKEDEEILRQNIIDFHGCYDPKSDDCWDKFQKCNEPNDNATYMTYDLRLEDMCESEWILCKDNIKC